VLELRDVPSDQRDHRLSEVVERVAARRVAARSLDLDEARSQVEAHLERTADTSALLDVVRDGAVVGGLWLGGEGDELVVHDAVLDGVLDPADVAAELVGLIVEMARERDARMVGIGVQPGDATHAAIAEIPGFRVRATNMVLSLDAEPADPAPLTLRPMTEQEFAGFSEGEVEGFAEELASAGMTPERALERSRTLFDELLPDGLRSPGMEFHVAEVDGVPVGDLWLSTGSTMAFVYDIEVRPDQRRKGYGAAIMNAAARRCRELGHPVLGLNVFAHNPNARALYDKLGYEVRNDYLARDLTDAS
jgi:GNAT superfamily N-acetyltransferase